MGDNRIEKQMTPTNEKFMLKFSDMYPSDHKHEIGVKGARLSSSLSLARIMQHGQQTNMTTQQYKLMKAIEKLSYSPASS